MDANICPKTKSGKHKWFVSTDKKGVANGEPIFCELCLMNYRDRNK